MSICVSLLLVFCGFSVGAEEQAFVAFSSDEAFMAGATRNKVLSIAPGKQLYNDCVTYATNMIALPYFNGGEKFSSTFSYNEFNSGAKNGVDIFYTMRTAMKNGIVGVSEFPQDSVTALPTADLLVRALATKADIEIIHEQDQGTAKNNWSVVLEKIRTAIDNEHPIVVLFYHNDDFRLYLNRGQYDIYNDLRVNGAGLRHAVTISGYSDSPELPGGGALLMSNSWGPEWGYAGYAWMSYSYMAQNICAVYEIKGIKKTIPTAYATVVASADIRHQIKYSVEVDGKQVRDSWDGIYDTDKRSDFHSAFDMSDVFSDDKTHGIKILLTWGDDAYAPKKVPDVKLVVGKSEFPLSHSLEGRKYTFETIVSSDSYVLAPVTLPIASPGWYNYSHTDPEERSLAEIAGCSTGRVGIAGAILVAPIMASIFFRRWR